MGQGSSIPLQDPIENLHTGLMRHCGADYDIATAGTLTYKQFLSYITQLNKICSDYKDEAGRVLMFAVKKGSDVSIFWKVKVRIACVKLDSATNTVESYRLLNIRQFLQVFRRITYECIEHPNGQDLHNSSSDGNNTISLEQQRTVVPPTLAASMALGDERGEAPLSDQMTRKDWSTNLEECVICLERQPDVILPCAHAYCLPCIEQWWEYCIPMQDECASSRAVYEMNYVDKTCPVCRESLKSTDDTWVISEPPDSAQVNSEIIKLLIGLTVTQDNSDNGDGAIACTSMTITNNSVVPSSTTSTSTTTNTSDTSLPQSEQS